MRTRLVTFLALAILSGCAAGSGAVVRGVGPDDLLKLRTGPGLEHEIIVGLPEGTLLNRQSCVATAGKTWCHVSLADRPGISGYVSADYLGHR